MWQCCGVGRSHSEFAEGRKQEVCVSVEGMNGQEWNSEGLKDLTLDPVVMLSAGTSSLALVLGAEISDSTTPRAHDDIIVIAAE